MLAVFHYLFMQLEYQDPTQHTGHTEMREKGYDRLKRFAFLNHEYVYLYLPTWL
jgi:hypothetical protein